MERRTNAKAAVAIIPVATATYFFPQPGALLEIVVSTFRVDTLLLATALSAVCFTYSPDLVASERPFAKAAPVAETDLHSISGAADLSMAALSEQSGHVANNSVNGNSVTGTINFDGQSFQNINGLSVLSANTGNNVSINSTMQVNISIGAAP